MFQDKAAVVRNYRKIERTRGKTVVVWSMTRASSICSTSQLPRRVKGWRVGLLCVSGLGPARGYLSLRTVLQDKIKLEVNCLTLYSSAYATRPANLSPLFNRSHKGWWRYQNFHFVVMQFSPSSFHFLASLDRNANAPSPYYENLPVALSSDV
jgi:hypothetical protein